MIDAVVRLLSDQQNSDGGWGAVRGKGSNTESTAFAVMALESTQRKDLTSRVQLGLNWLSRHQNGDGSWRLNDVTPSGSWSTAAAMLCLSSFSEQRSRAVKAAQWALIQEGNSLGWLGSLILWFTGQKDINKINMDLKGWPWASGSFSWVEPTSYFLIGLKRLRPVLDGTNVKDRIRQGELMIYDRVCEEGGWNYGNSKVYGEALWPYPDITALALIALQDHPDAQANRKSLETLEKALNNTGSGLALSWSIICFKLYGRNISEWRQRLVESFEKTAFLGETKTLALAVLALADAPQFFRI
jgi:Prenyltransferase and squalene oxidase repeat.